MEKEKYLRNCVIIYFSNKYRLMMGALLFFLVGALSCSFKKNDLVYFGQQPPGLTPEIFAPGSISLADRSEFGSVFNAAANEFYFGIDRDGTSEIWWSRLESSGEWSAPLLLIGGQDYSCNDPFLSTDETKLYFISNRSAIGETPKQNYDIWYIQRGGSGWDTEMVALDTAINSPGNEYYMSFTANESIYFSSNWRADKKAMRDFNIYRSDYREGGYQKAQILPQEINSSSYEADVFISPDESYMIFCSIRENGLGEGDLYISFQDASGNWSDAENLGDKINTPGHELCPFISRDGKYFFFTSNRDIYWVDAKVIESFRN